MAKISIRNRLKNQNAYFLWKEDILNNREKFKNYCYEFRINFIEVN